MAIKIYAYRKCFASLLHVELHSTMLLLITQWGREPNLHEKKKNELWINLKALNIQTVGTLGGTNRGKISIKQTKKKKNFQEEERLERVH